MTTTPQSTDSAALPAPVPATQSANAAPQSMPPALAEPAIKPQAAPVKRTRKAAPQPAADSTASLQPAVKQAAVRRTPATRAQTVAPKPAVPKAALAQAAPTSTAPARTAPAKSVPAKPAARKAALAKAAAPAGADKKPTAVKAKKEKLVRDSFTIPKSEFAVLDQLKRRADIMARSVKKSELLRAGIKLLASLSNDALLAALSQVPTIKTGRPTLKK